MLYIRADGNAEIGTGHVMRCLSIAKAAEKQGKDCTFILADKNMQALLQEQGFPCICLDTIWNDLDKEIDVLSKLIIDKQIESLLVDSYFVTHKYLSQLCEITNVTYIDDLNAFQYPCHTLINYNIYAEKFDYPSRYPNTKLLLGTKYAPLREEFQDLPQRVINETVKSVLITTGGADPYNLAGKLIKAAKENNDTKHLELHIVVGKFNVHIDELMLLAEKYDGVILHQNVQKMSELMLACDIAVSAGGSTTYELCACGTPTILFTLADNQFDIARTFDELGIMPYAGDARDGVETIGLSITDRLSEICRLHAQQGAYSKIMLALVDGIGAIRITENI